MPQRDYDLVALDLDGTVLDSEKRVSDGVKGAVARLGAEGVHVVICTGRRWRTALPVMAELEGSHPVLVCCGGALVKDVDTGRTLHTVPLAPDLTREAVHAMRGAGLVPFALYDRPLDEHELWASELDRERLAEMLYFARNEDSFDYFPGERPPPEGCVDVFTIDHESRVRPAGKAVAERLGGRALVTEMLQTAYGSDQLAVEVHAAGATKWAALALLLGRWRIPPERVVAVGDDVNDVEMLRGAGLSFAMGNAVPEAKRAAYRVTAGHDEDGVAAALREAFGWA